ncbi:MAG: hypothetical protein LBS56_09135 [Propionibacteriaceae bacterium]|nr:hypothetical protein [Propionibacteriaceae bacterium]
MSFLDVLGWVATACSLSVAAPQAARLLRTRDPRGVSLFLWRVTVGVMASWVVHGVRIGQVALVICNVGTSALAVVVVVLLHRFRHVAWWRSVLPGLGVLAVLCGVDHFFGSLWFGLAAAGVQLASNVGQSVKLVRAPSVTGVAPLFLVLQNAAQVLWSLWGFLVRDPGTAWAAAMVETLVLFNLVWWTVRRIRRV